MYFGGNRRWVPLFSMAGEKRRDCDTRRRQSTDAQNMWKGKWLSQVFACEEIEDILDFFHLPTLSYFS